MTQILCSCHASIRAQQRGVAPSHIEAVGLYADKEAYRGGGCTSIWISSEKFGVLGLGQQRVFH